MAWPKPSVPRISTSSKKADVGTRPPTALMTDQATIVTAIALVRFQRSARYPEGSVAIPFTKMNAENRIAMSTSLTPKAAFSWLLSPRTMYWSRPSTNSVKPTTHMGQSVTRMRARGRAPRRRPAARVSRPRRAHVVAVRLAHSAARRVGYDLGPGV